MLNALWFKANGGAEKYAEYTRAAGPFVNELGGSMTEAYVPQQSLIGDWDPDLFFLVEWPDYESFQKLAQHQGYLQIAHLREEALDKSLLIQCSKLEAL